MPRLAVFDVDHTITRHSTGRRLIQCGRKSGIFGPGSLVTLPYHYVRYRSGTINAERAVAVLARLNGRTREDLEAIAVGCFERRIRADVMKDARESVEAHVRAGDIVVFATSSLG
jgi:phosphoserine phosphatase